MCALLVGSAHVASHATPTVGAPIPPNYSALVAAAQRAQQRANSETDPALQAEQWQQAALHFAAIIKIGPTITAAQRCSAGTEMIATIHAAMHSENNAAVKGTTTTVSAASPAPVPESVQQRLAMLQLYNTLDLCSQPASTGFALDLLLDLYNRTGQFEQLTMLAQRTLASPALTSLPNDTKARLRVLVTITQRKHAELLGNSEYSEHKIAAHGALTVDEAGFLLVVQDVVRDESQSAAFATLRGPQKEAVDFWRAELLPHRRELRELLGFGAVEPADASPALVRPPKARTAPAGLVEPDPRQFNRGQRTFRVGFHRGASRMFIGWLVGGTLGGIALNQLAMVWPLFAMLALGGAVGWGWGRRLKYWECSDPHCGRRMNAAVAQCPGCGGAIAAEIANARLRLAKEEELDLVAATEGKDR